VHFWTSDFRFLYRRVVDAIGQLPERTGLMNGLLDRNASRCTRAAVRPGSPEPEEDTTEEQHRHRERRKAFTSRPWTTIRWALRRRSAARRYGVV
jgi:hypothetical protein